MKKGKITVACQKCNKTYRFPLVMHEKQPEGNSTGITAILLEPPCKHKMLVYVDVKGTVRSTVQIDRHVTELEPIELQGFDDKLVELEKEHARLNAIKDYNNAFLVKKEIARVEKERDAFKLFLKERDDRAR